MMFLVPPWTLEDPEALALLQAWEREGVEVFVMGKVGGPAIPLKEWEDFLKHPLQ